ncbi:MAG: dCTP deaminase [Spirochaetaceae bacterium]|nr:dCTP deaminase [Spirochaetaceae bacterium]|tara:strand:+ start:6995 stop:7516 length:522 start_codon:yes stop_codon:yes gene_type:complete
MILTGPEIKKRLGTDIKIDPYNENSLNPNSYNLTLHHELMIYTDPPLDMKKANPTEKIIMDDDGYLLQPGRLYLGRTLEYTETHNLVPMLEGRSSIGRLGMFVHVTAGFGDVGFCGFWTLEISTIHPIRIYPNIGICQIFYHTIEGDVKEYDSGKYQKNTGIQPSLLYREFQK